MLVKKNLKKVDMDRFEELVVKPLSKKDAQQVKEGGVLHRPFMVDEKFIAIDIYKCDGTKRPMFIGRAFADPADARYGLLRSDLTWTTANIDNISWFYPNKALWLTDADKELELSALGGKEIQSWLNELGVNALKIKHKKDIEQRDEDMSLVRPLTKDMEDYLSRRVFKGNNFAIFDKETGAAKCTACGKSIPIEGLKHLKKCKCPECGETVQARSAKTGIANQYYNAEIVQVAKGEVIFRYFNVHRYFHVKNMEWKSGYSEQGRSVYPAGVTKVSGSRDYALTYNWYGETGVVWKPVRELYCGGIYGGGNVRLWGASRIYRKNLSALKKTGFKYIVCANLNKALDMIEKGGAYCMFHFETMLSEAADTAHPEYEYMLKIGWIDAFYNQLRAYYDYGRLKIDNEKKSIYEMLGLSKEQYTSLGKNPPFAVVKKMQKANEAWQNLLEKEGNGILEKAAKARAEASDKTLVTPITGDEVKQIQGSGIRITMEDYTLLRCFMSHHKIVKYLSEKKCDAALWTDYIEMMIKLDYKKDEIEFYPKDLKKAHDDAVKLFEVEKDGIYNRKLKMIAPVLKERYAFDKKGYTVIVPESVEDFKKEAAHMNNCVASHYLEPCAQGDKVVLFLRKKDELDKSFVDIEVKNGEIRQLYAADNNTPPVEVTRLIYEDFAKEKGLQKAA